MKGWCAKITEGNTRLELINNIKPKQADGFIIDENNDQEINFV